MLLQAKASGDPEALLRAGAAALQDGAYSEAIVPVKNFLRKNRGNARLWQLLGLLHRSLEDLAPSVEAFQKAAELLPGDAMIAHGLACVRFEAGLPAAAHFERALGLAPSDRSILLRLAAALIAEGRGDSAMAAVEQELRRSPQWIEAHNALARVRWTSGDQDGFAQSFERALQAMPGDIGLWRAYIETFLNAQLFERGLAAVERGRRAAGAHPAFDAAEAICRSELGQAEHAAALFLRLAPIKSVSLIVYYLRHLLRTGQIREAAEIAGKSAPNDPTNRIWPYASIAWRLTGDPRWEWLEGDSRFVGVYDLSKSLPSLDALAARLRTLHRTLNQPLDQSLRGGTQTEGHLLPRIEPEIRMLRRAIVEAVERHVAQLPPPRPGHPLLVQRRSPIRFAGSWSVRLTGGGRHVEHFHPAGWISSALYVALPGDAERGGAHSGWLGLGEASELGLDLPPIRLVEPKPGRLVLFPSTMWHGTRPFEAGERLTVAFDVKRPD
ncbi:MAG TPA: putative 2OG-Fe(II) oxygenase [Allosphingosinicella sp.]|jgi:tetratricopeptide (TPR) repeat protein